MKKVFSFLVLIIPGFLFFIVEYFLENYLESYFPNELGLIKSVLSLVITLFISKYLFNKYEIFFLKLIENMLGKNLHELKKNIVINNPFNKIINPIFLKISDINCYKCKSKNVFNYYPSKENKNLNVVKCLDCDKLSFYDGFFMSILIIISVIPVSLVAFLDFSMIELSNKLGIKLNSFKILVFFICFIFSCITFNTLCRITLIKNILLKKYE